MVVKPVHLKKASALMLVTVSGMSMEIRPEQFSKTFDSILVTDNGISIDVIPDWNSRKMHRLQFL